MNRSDSNRHHEDPAPPNELLDEFDAAWASLLEPRIEDFLPRVLAALRPKLLEDLIAIEWEYRSRIGHRFDAQEYVKRFPDASAMIEKLWNEMPELTGESSNSGNLRFQIHRVLARGGIAEILEAWDRTLKREVAIKILQAQSVDSPDLRRRFRREAEIIAKLEHPGIIPIHDYGHFRNDEPFYAMRLVKDGQTLEDRIRASQQNLPPAAPAGTPDDTKDAGSKRRQNPEKTEFVDVPVTVPDDSIPDVTANAGHATDPPPPALSPIETRLLLERFLTLTDTVKFAHSQGVLHRDIKPGNVLLGPYGETFLIDWGFALDIHAKAEPGEDVSEYEKSFSASSCDRPGKAPRPFKGTPVYCSPEQAKGKPSTEAYDIYSLGALLYHMMTGRPPRRPDPAHKDPLESLLEDARENRFVPPRTANPRLDRAMEAIILKAMNTRPQDRYRSAKELGDDLRRWLANEPVTALPEYGSWTRRLDRHVRRQRKAALAAAILIACALGAAGLRTPFFAARRPETSAVDQERTQFARTAEMAAALTKSRSPGWSMKVDALLEELDDIRKRLPTVSFPRIDHTRIARKSFSDLIEASGPAHSKLDFSIAGMAFRPGTRQAAVVEYDAPQKRSTGRVRLIDVDSAKGQWKGSAHLPEIAAEPDGISTLTFSPDGKWLIAASRAGWGSIWNLDRAADPVPAEATRPNFSWKIHDNGGVERMFWADSTTHGLRLVLLCDDETVSLWEWKRLKDAAEGNKGPDDIKPTAIRKFEADVSDLLPTAKGESGETLFAAIGGRLRRLEAKVRSIKEIDTAADAPDLGEPFVMAWHPSGSIVTAGRNAISIVDARTMRIQRRIRNPQSGLAHHGGIDRLQVTADGQYAVTMSDDEADRRMNIWNLDDPKDLLRFDLPGEPGTRCGFFVENSAQEARQNRIRVWGPASLIPFDLIMPSLYERFPTDSKRILSLDVSREKKPRIGVLLPGDVDDKIRLDLYVAANRSVRSSSPVSVPNPPDWAELAIASDGDKIAVATQESYVKVIHDLHRNPLDPPFHLFSGSARNLIGWDDQNRLFGLLESETEIRSLPAEQKDLNAPNVTVFSHHPVKLVAPGPSDASKAIGGTLFAGCIDGSVRAWEMKNAPRRGEVSRIWKTGPAPLYSLTVTDDGKWVVCGDRRGQLHLIGADSAQDTPLMTIEEAHPDLIASIAIAQMKMPADDRLIMASGSRDGSLKLWILRNDYGGAGIEPLVELPPMAGPIRKLRFIRAEKAGDSPKLELAVHSEGLFALRIWSIQEILASHAANGPTKLDP